MTVRKLKKIFLKDYFTLLAMLPIAITFIIWVTQETLGHYIVEQAYYGTSPFAIINHAMTNRTLHPLIHYISYTDGIILRMITVTVVVSYIALLIGATRVGQINRMFPSVVICVGVTAVFVTLWCYAHYTTNIPYQDDYDTSLEFLINIDDAKSMAERGEILIRRHSSHIIVISNVANIIDWKLFGILNFRHLVLLAFTFLLGMVVLLQVQFKGLNRDIHAVTVALLCVNTLFYSAALTGIPSLQYFPVLTLTATALFLLSKPGYTRMCFAVLMMLLATFSSGNGMFGFIAGAAILATRSFKALLVWSACGLLITTGFFQTFETNKEYVLASGLTQSIGDLSRYYLTFLGSIVQVIPYYGDRLAPFLGLGLLLICVFLMQQKYYQKNAFITGWILFMLITAGVVTAARCGIANSDALASRYTINSCILVALIYLALVELYETRLSRLHFAFICFLAFLFNITAMLISVPAMIERHERLTTGALRYVTQADRHGLVRTFPERAENDLIEAEKRNIYHMASGLGIQPPYKTPPAKVWAVVPPDI